jgi:hypothetical protein
MVGDTAGDPFKDTGSVAMAPALITSTSRTARRKTACRVVWQGTACRGLHEASNDNHLLLQIIIIDNKVMPPPSRGGVARISISIDGGIHDYRMASGR